MHLQHTYIDNTEDTVKEVSEQPIWGPEKRVQVFPLRHHRWRKMSSEEGNGR